MKRVRRAITLSGAVALDDFEADLDPLAAIHERLTQNIDADPARTQHADVVAEARCLDLGVLLDRAFVPIRVQVELVLAESEGETFVLPLEGEATAVSVGIAGEENVAREAPRACHSHP